MIILNDYPVGAVIDFDWPTFSVAGDSITIGTPGTIRVYKGNSLTQRTSNNGITENIDFDGIVGVHHVRIDTNDNTDPGFWAAGGEYAYWRVGMVIDGKTVSYPVARFSIERSGGALALIKAQAAAADWDATNRNEIRYVFGMTGTKTAPPGGGTIQTILSNTDPIANGTLLTQIANRLIGDGTITHDQALRVIVAYAAGLTHGHDTGTPVFRNLANNKDVISGTLDGSGNRITSTVNP